MKDKRRRLVELGKNLLILLLALSAFYQLLRTQSLNGFWNLLEGVPAAGPGPTPVQDTSAAVQPLRLAVYHNDQRYGVQYDSAETDAAFSSLSTLLSEALGSAAQPELVSERVWRAALCRTGIYVDLLYPIPFSTLYSQLGGSQGSSALDGSVRRICLAAHEGDGVALYYINEDTGLYYACGTTLSREFHLDAAVHGWSPNGALFAFEVPGMETLAPYTLLTSTPRPAVYRSGNPLLEDSARVSELLTALTFQPQGASLDPAVGGQIVEGNDSLRLSRSGLITYHAIGDSGFRFSFPENDTPAALDRVQALAEATVGAWCGQARLCLARVEETADGLEISFQYCLNGSPVALPEGQAAARFVVCGGAVTDFSLYLRTYSATEDTAPVMPAVQAAAAMEAKGAQGKELTLLYEDTGGELVSAGWAAV